MVDDTVLIQPAGTAVERSLRGTGADVHGVLLTEGILVSLVGPVVSGHVVSLAVRAQVAAAQCGIGVQLTVGTDEILTVGNSVHVITQTAQGSVVGTHVCSSGVLTQGIHVVVVHHRVVGLIVHGRISHLVIVLHGT